MRAGVRERVVYTLRRLIGWGFRVTTKVRHRNWRGSDDFPLPAPSDKPLILFVHGYEGAPREFHFLYEALGKAFRERCDLAVVDGLDPTMGLSADGNAHRVDEFFTEHGLRDRPVYIIGHSMGGIIARRYACRDEVKDIRAFVMIATPNGGINLWNLLPIHWMRSRGFQARFNDCYPPPPGIPVLLIAGTRGIYPFEGYPNDGTVGCWSVDRLKDLLSNGSHIERLSYPLSHTGLLRDERVAADIAAFIQAVLDK
ncbi:MAG: alpha/beta hydrolase [Armatimonadota bacterium]